MRDSSRALLFPGRVNFMEPKNPHASPPSSPVYSHTRIAEGPLLFVSGQIPVDVSGNVAEDDVVAQTHAVLDRIEALLRDHGLGLKDLVRVTYFLTRIEDLADVRKVLVSRLPEPRPTSTLAQVSALIDPRFLIEIDAIASVPRSAPPT